MCFFNNNDTITFDAINLTNHYVITSATLLSKLFCYSVLALYVVKASKSNTDNMEEEE